MGVNLTNIGTKLTYVNAKENFLPTNLRIGAGYGLNNNPDNRLTLLRDVTKLLVPKVCLEGGAIKCGDLLVTSSRDPVWR